MAFNRWSDLIHEDVLAEMKSELYDFQKEAIEAAMNKVYSADKYIGKIILPTGAGKTKIAEYLADSSGGSTQHFQRTYHVDALKHDDEQPTGNSKGTHKHHQTENHHDIHVKNCQPRKGMLCNSLDAEYSVGHAIAVGTMAEQLQLACQFIYLLEVMHRHLQSRRFFLLPAIQSAHSIYISDDIVFVVVIHVRLKHTCNGQAPCPHLLFAHEVGKNPVTRFDT